MVAGEYEIEGCLASGGIGWIYLAREGRVSDRWVVLKGLLNDATGTALVRRRLLTEVEHPNIVKIFNVVQHENMSYLVMEYVGGKSLKQVLVERREANTGEPDPLPPAEAIAAILEVLPALGYLHDNGLLFCNLKPSKPVGPSIPSDLFTVARTLAVLCIDFRNSQTTYRYTLPPRETVPLFERYDSLYTVLLKATAPDPGDRYQSADEMADKLNAVLREIGDNE